MTLKSTTLTKMAGKGYSTVQLLDDSEEDSDEELINTNTTSKDLKFQDFSTTTLPDATEENKNMSLDNSKNLYEDDGNDDDDENELLSRDKKSPSFWTFEYYQSFFDVDTEQVLSRITYSMVPQKQNYLLNKIRPNPDLYGPFWVCTTLVFTIAICGNLSSFFASEGGTWKSDFQLVSLSAGVIFSYAWLIPTFLWFFFSWRGNLAGFAFFEILCVYGYSLSIFIPISILWVVPYEWLRWIFVLIGVISSGSVLALTFWRAVEDDNKKYAIAAIVMIVLLHTALAIGFKLYFFKSNTIRSLPPTLSPTSITTLISTTLQHTSLGI